MASMSEASHHPIRHGQWADLSSPALAALDRERLIAVLPVGATEQHGPHLPLSVDSDLATAVLNRALGLAAAPSNSVAILKFSVSNVETKAVPAQ